MSVEAFHTVEAIIEVNRESAQARDGIRIIELSTLGDVIPRDEAEAIRKELLTYKVGVRQLTNQAAFGPWTEVADFIKRCMNVRFIVSSALPIKAEVLVFDDVVAIYRIDPDVSLTIIRDPAFAEVQKALFDLAWSRGEPLNLLADGSTPTH